MPYICYGLISIREKDNFFRFLHFIRKSKKSLFHRFYKKRIKLIQGLILWKAMHSDHSCFCIFYITRMRCSFFICMFFSFLKKIFKIILKKLNNILETITHHPIRWVCKQPKVCLTQPMGRTASYT